MTCDDCGVSLEPGQQWSWRPAICGPCAESHLRDTDTWRLAVDLCECLPRHELERLLGLVERKVVAP